MGGFNNSRFQPHLNIAIAAFLIGALVGWPKGGLTPALLYGVGGGVVVYGGLAAVIGLVVLVGKLTGKEPQDPD